MKSKLIYRKGTRVLLVLGLMFSTLQCAQEQPLQLFIEKNMATVFYGEASDLCGYPLTETVDGPGFKYCGPCIIWKGTEILQLVSLKVEFPTSTEFPSGFTCSFDGDDIEGLFPDGNQRAGTITKPPYTDGKLHPVGGKGNLSCGRGFVCTGATPANVKSQFTITGKATVRAVKEASGRSITTSTRVIFNYFPE